MLNWPAYWCASPRLAKMPDSCSESPALRAAGKARVKAVMAAGKFPVSVYITPKHLQAFCENKVVIEALCDCNCLVGRFDPVKGKSAQVFVARNRKQTHRAGIGRGFVG